ncbi:MAG: glycosyltransferase family 2 protein [Prosthecobacter sp.]
MKDLNTLSIEPSVTICLPTLNARQFLPERMESILAQTETNWELIVCDSYSADGTWEYFQEFKSDPRVHLYQVPREGLYAGWNECLKRAKGEFIYIATADDTMYPDCLERLIQPLRFCTEAGVAVGGVDYIDEAGVRLSEGVRQIHRFLDVHTQNAWCRISGDTAFVMLSAFDWGLGSVTGFLFRRSLLDSNRAGLFPTNLSFMGDCEWALRAVLSMDVVWTSHSVATWRQHSSQASNRKDRVLEAWFFRESLKRVLDDESILPQSIRKVPGWKKILLQARTRELQMASALNILEMRRDWRSFVRRLIHTSQISPATAFSRCLRFFTHPSIWNPSAADIFQTYIKTFQLSWPPSPLQFVEPLK